MPTKEAAAPVGLRSRVTSLRQQAVVSLGGPGARRVRWRSCNPPRDAAGEAKAYSAAKVDDGVESVVALELVSFCGFSIPHRLLCAQLWKPASRPIQNQARGCSYH